MVFSVLPGNREENVSIATTCMVQIKRRPLERRLIVTLFSRRTTTLSAITLNVMIQQGRMRYTRDLEPIAAPVIS
jgi:hypothetical protein